MVEDVVVVACWWEWWGIGNVAGRDVHESCEAGDDDEEAMDGFGDGLFL